MVRARSASSRSTQQLGDASCPSRDRSSSAAISASGSSTKRRSRKRGCGTLSPGSSMTRRRTGSGRGRASAARPGTGRARPSCSLDRQQALEQRARGRAASRRRARRSGSAADRRHADRRRSRGSVETSACRRCGSSGSMAVSRWCARDRPGCCRARSRRARDVDRRYSIQRTGSTPSPVLAPAMRRAEQVVAAGGAWSKRRWCSSDLAEDHVQHACGAARCVTVGHACAPLVDERLRPCAQSSLEDGPLAGRRPCRPARQRPTPVRRAPRHAERRAARRAATTRASLRGR